jgi:hypothetical protein
MAYEYEERRRCEQRGSGFGLYEHLYRRIRIYDSAPAGSGSDCGRDTARDALGGETYLANGRYIRRGRSWQFIPDKPSAGGGPDPRWVP